MAPIEAKVNNPYQAASQLMLLEPLFSLISSLSADEIVPRISSTASFLSSTTTVISPGSIIYPVAFGPAPE
jgi:hypothetical protein